jgi:transposase
MYHVGLGIHTKRIALCALDEKGQVVRRSQVRNIEEMLRTLKELRDRFEVSYEASCGYGHYHDLLQPLATRVLVAHPGRLRLIFRSKDKNDRRDAERLAKLLYLGETPTVHVPSVAVRTWRELINCRSQVIAKHTQAKNTVRALLRSAGVIPPKQPRLWTKSGLAWLRKLELPTASQQLRRDLLLEEIETLNRQVRRIEQQLNQQARQTAAVAQLRSIPGVGIRTAEAVAAFLDDPQRFADAKAVGRYFGLVPSQDQSGEKNRLVSIDAIIGSFRKCSLKETKPISALCDGLIAGPSTCGLPPSSRPRREASRTSSYSQTPAPSWRDGTKAGRGRSRNARKSSACRRRQVRVGRTPAYSRVIRQPTSTSVGSAARTRAPRS